MSMYAVTYQDDDIDAGRIVVADGLSIDAARHIAETQEALGYGDVRVECWA